MAIPIKKTNKAAEGLDFFSPDSPIFSHGGGFDLPEGDYIWTGLEVQMFNGWDGKQEPRLGVMITLVPKDDPTAPILMASGEAHEGKIFYSFGTKAHLSFAPNAEGTGLEPIPGGNGKITDSSNWMVLAKSLSDSGLPKGIATNDVSALAGMWVHMQNIPEPETRKAFRAQTGDAEAEKKQYPRNIAVVSEIFDDGKPWEGTGGIPEEKPKKAGVKVPAKAPAKKEPEPEPEAEGGEIDEATQTAALGAMAAVLEKAPKNGTPKAAFKLNVAKQVKKEYDDDTMQVVTELILENEENLSAMLDQLDYKLAGPMVKPK